MDDRPFVFDHVFGRDTSQESVYRDLVSPLIDKMLLGFHCTVLAYGQSGNGKTYTMGLHKNLQNDENCGLITRSISTICSRVREQCSLAEEQENLPELSVSFIEIYNEKVYDLLSKNFTEPVNLKSEFLGFFPRESGLLNFFCSVQISGVHQEAGSWLRECL